ncbi:MAG: glycosyltransferase family 4 protein [Bacillota bacterium]
MRVWMYPKDSDTNQYNSLFSTSIERMNKNTKVLNFKQRYLFKLKKNDVLHFHWPHSLYQSNSFIVMCVKAFLFIIILNVLKLFGIRLVWTMHNKFPHKIKFFNLEKLVRKKIINCCSLLIVLSQSIKSEISKEFSVNPQKIRVIKHGHYEGVYPEVTREKYTEIKLKANEKFIYLFIGTIQEYKGVINLIKVFKKLEKNSLLIIAGNPSIEMKDKLNKFISEENIVFDLRFIPDDEIFSIISIADAIVLPYKEITSSGSALLALTYNKPIIAPNTPFMVEYFNENTSELYEKHSENGLYDALVNVTKREFTIKSFEKNKQELNWNKIGEELNDLYKELLI